MEWRAGSKLSVPRRWGADPNGGWTEAEAETKEEKGKKKRKSQQRSGRGKREGFLICFLGRMTKLRGMQQRGEREVIKSSKHEERER